MRPRRKRTWTLIISVTLFTAVVGWFALNPEVLAPWLTRLAERHLMRGLDGTLEVGAYHGRAVDGLSLTDVRLEVRDDRGGVTVVGVDTLELDYDLPALLRTPPSLDGVTIRGLELLTVLPEPDAPADGDSDRRGSLPAFTIGNVDLHRATIRVSDAEGRVVEEIPSLDWTGALQSDGPLTVVSRGGRVDWTSRMATLADPRGVLVIDGDGVTVHNLEVVFNDGPATVSGTRLTNGDLDLDVRAADVRVTDVEDLIDMTLGFVAEGDVVLGLRSRDGFTDMDVDFDGVLEGYELAGFQGRATLDGQHLVFQTLNGRINGALFSGEGVFDVRDPADVIMRLTGHVADVDLSRDLVPEVVLPETWGWGRLDLWRRDATNETSVRGWLRDGRVATVPFDSLYAEVDADSSGVELRLIDLEYRGQRAVLNGSADLDGVFAGRIEIDAPDLSALPEEWPVPPLGGAAVIAGEITGVDPVFAFSGEARLGDVEVSAVSADSMTVQLAISDLLDRPGVRADATADGFSVADVPLGAAHFGGLVTDERLHLDYFRASRGDTALDFRGQATFTDSLAVFRVPELALVLEGSRWVLPEPMSFRSGAGRFDLEPMELRSARGHLLADVSWDHGRERLGGTVDVAHLDLELFNPFLRDSVLNGEISAVCRLGGSPGDPSFSLRGELHDADLPLARVDSLGVDALFRGGRLDIASCGLTTDMGRVDVTGTVLHPGVPLDRWWPDAALDLHLDIVDGDWAFMDQFAIPALERIAGRVDGSLEIAGTTSAPEIEGGLESAPFHVHWLHMDSLRGRIAYADHQLTLADLQGRKGTLDLAGRIELPLVMDFMSEPVSPVDGPLYMSLAIPEGSDLAALKDMTNAFAESGGRGGLDLVVSGRADHPYYSGTVSVRDGSCVIRGLNEVYHHVDVDGVWQGDVLTLADLRGREGERGVITGDGEVVFKGLELESFDVRFDADRFLVASIPDLRALVKGEDIHLGSVKVGPDSLIVPRFGGELELIRARYTGDFSEQPSVNDPRVATVAPDWLADVEIHAPPRSAKIVNSTMELFLGGDIRVVRDMSGLDVLGGADIDQGHLPVFNNDFRVSRGEVDFSGDFGVIPTLDISADTEVRLPTTDGGSRRLERIDISVTGSAMSPTVDFSSESGYARQNIERMLLGLSPHATDTQTSTVVRNQTMAAGFNLLEREVAQSLNVVDTFDIISGRERIDGTTQTLIGVGKYIGRDLYVKFAQAITDTDREVLVEYQISNHLLLQSEISRRQYEALGNTTYSVDLKYRFEY